MSNNSNINAKVDGSNKNNELVVVNTREGVISENLWIIGVSKTHPGLKYYFNTVTGVSLWHISKEDMLRAKQTMKANGNQSQYLNCPEPKEPPPGKRTSMNLPVQTYCEHIEQYSKSYNKQLVNSRLGRETPAFTCNICCATINSTPNVITVNFQQCPHPTCISPLENACTTMPQREIQSPTTLFDNLNLEKKYCNKTLLESKKTSNNSFPEMMVYDLSNEQLNTHRHSLGESSNHNTSYFESLDLTPLKMFAKNGVVKDKWFIIADAEVYLHHITFLKSVVNSDNQCCLMVPQNVKIELENATKTEFRTKAYCASYYIYNMFDNGFAHIDEDSSKHIHDKSNGDHILESCSKLGEQNFYVVVISNDMELQKYRNKIYLPIFTVAELKEYLYKSNNSVTKRSPNPTLNVSENTKHIKLSATDNTSILSNEPPNIHKSTIENSDVVVEQKMNNQSSIVFKNNERQVHGFYDISKVTVDAEVQTNINSTHLDEMENVDKKMCLLNQNDNINKRKEISTSNRQSCEPSLHSSAPNLRKRIKLRRKTTLNPSESNLSTKLVNPNESHNMAISNITTMSSSVHNLLLNEKSELNKNISNINLKTNVPSPLNTLKQKNEENALPDQTWKPCRGLQSIRHKENIENKNVMFEVTTEMMNQSLRRKCDEWVSRFVQIMEEALTQVLRKNSSLYLPPPWNMYEAVICIEEKFNNDEDVADASKKFLNILNRICDDKGNINANISPIEYMEMYSFGVYIIDALQGIFSTCEDLQTAAESLSKLLNDIQDPDSDMLNLETFQCTPREKHFDDIESANDNVEVLMIIETESLSNERTTEDTENLHKENEAVTSVDVSNNNSERLKNESQFRITIGNTEVSNCLSSEDHTSKSQNCLKDVNVESNVTSQEDNNVICTETTTACHTVSVTSQIRYNLRSRRTMSSEQQDQQFVPKENSVMKNDVNKSKFLSNFSLHKNLLEEKSHIFVDNCSKDITSKELSDHVKSSRSIKTNEGRSYPFNSNTTGLSQKINIHSNEPKIVRNFVICSEFENRLKTRRVQNEMEEIDFEEELMETDYIDEEDSGDTGRFEIEEFPEYHDNVNVNVDQYIDQEIRKSPEYFKINFKYFIRKIAQEIKELSSEIYTFSQNSCEALNSLNTFHDKGLIRERAEQVQLCIDKLCAALTNIHNRDKNGGYTVQALLKRTEFNDISVDEDQMEAYGAFIARCLEQALDLKSTISDVLSAVCEF